MPGESLRLVWPAAQYLDGYVHALRHGWSPDNLRPQRASEELARIAEDPQGFVSQQVDREASGPPITLPDGSAVPRLPGYYMWMWDREFCGTIGFRWQPGTTDLLPYCLGHVGYSVVPWKRRSVESVRRDRAAHLRHRTPVFANCGAGRNADGADDLLLVLDRASAARSHECQRRDRAVRSAGVFGYRARDRRCAGRTPSRRSAGRRGSRASSESV